MTDIADTDASTARANIVYSTIECFPIEKKSWQYLETFVEKYWLSYFQIKECLSKFSCQHKMQQHTLLGVQILLIW